LRTIQTCKGITKAFESHEIVGTREEPRIREQDFGNFQDPSTMGEIKEERLSFGRFFFRFPNGESGADVYDRMSDFIGSLFRRMNNLEGVSTVVIVTHGLALRVFLMRWFHWSVEQFEQTYNPGNGEMVVINKDPETELFALDPRTAQVLNCNMEVIKDNRELSTMTCHIWDASVKARREEYKSQVFEAHQEKGLVATSSINKEVMMRAIGISGSERRNSLRNAAARAGRISSNSTQSSAEHSNLGKVRGGEEFALSPLSKPPNPDYEIDHFLDANGFSSFIEDVSISTGMPVEDLLDLLQDAGSRKLDARKHLKLSNHSSG